MAGVIYPTILRYLIDAVGFNNAVRYVATVTSLTCIFSFIFCTPDPAHEHHTPKTWSDIRTWVDAEAFRNKAWCWFTAAIAFMFFGFYPVFFNLEEVRLSFSLQLSHQLTSLSGHRYADLVLANQKPPRSPLPIRPTNLYKHFGFWSS